MDDETRFWIAQQVSDVAEQSYYRIVDAITNRCINEMPIDTKLSSEMLRVPDIQDGLSSIEGNHKIFDTGDLSQVNLVYNNITFQVYLVPKLQMREVTEQMYD